MCRPTNLDEALALFEEVAEAAAAGAARRGPRARTDLPARIGGGARAWPARAFAFEIEQGIGVVERLLEYPFEGAFEFEGEAGRAPVRVRGKADRIDLLADGTLRVVDYKLGRAPKPARALQLPIYGVCAQQQLERERGTALPVARAGYVAFKEKNAFVDLGRQVRRRRRRRCATGSSGSSTPSRGSRAGIPAEPGRAVDVHALRVPACLPQGLRR